MVDGKNIIESLDDIRSRNPYEGNLISLPAAWILTGDNRKIFVSNIQDRRRVSVVSARVLIGSKPIT